MTDITRYANIERLVSDYKYAESKYIKVTSIPTPKMIELKNELLDVKSDDSNWKEKITKLKERVTNEKKNGTRFILKYDKTKIDSNNSETLGLFRSIVTDGKKIIVFSPPKSINYAVFNKNNKDTKLDYLEYVEGTMVNLYYDDIKDGWELSTRSNIGAKYSFYDNTELTFSDMFLSAFTDMKLEFNNFKKGFSYSFVLQHPENRIVVPFDKAQLILTNVYKIEGFTVKEMELDNAGQWIESDAYDKLKFPRPLNKLIGTNDNDIETIYDTITTGENIDYTMVGGVIINRENGNRVKIRNPFYEYVRQLRGNNAKFQYQYYHLRKYGRVKEFLKYFPEMGNELEKYRKQLHKWTDTLHSNYIKCYINKEKELKKFPFEFRTHMFELHQEYLGNLVMYGGYISKKVVINYVNDLPSSYLMSSINYPLKKINIEKSKIVVDKCLNETNSH